MVVVSRIISAGVFCVRLQCGASIVLLVESLLLWVILGEAGFGLKLLVLKCALVSLVGGLYGGSLEHGDCRGKPGFLFRTVGLLFLTGC